MRSRAASNTDVESAPNPPGWEAGLAGEESVWYGLVSVRGTCVQRVFMGRWECACACTCVLLSRSPQWPLCPALHRQPSDHCPSVRLHPGPAEFSVLSGDGWGRPSPGPGGVAVSCDQVLIDCTLLTCLSMTDVPVWLNCPRLWHPVVMPALEFGVYPSKLHSGWVFSCKLVACGKFEIKWT